MTLIRKCGLCGAAVTKRHDGEEPARGLGHWHCTKGCGKRRAENKKGFAVYRDIPVVTVIHKENRQHGNEKEHQEK